jgi:hypothetical protein
MLPEAKLIETLEPAYRHYILDLDSLSLPADFHISEIMRDDFWYYYADTLNIGDVVTVRHAGKRFRLRRGEAGSLDGIVSVQWIGGDLIPAPPVAEVAHG